MLIDDGLELLDESECVSLLCASRIGRVGITIGGLPVILPVNFTWTDGSIVFRAGEGTKLHAASNGAVIAFELDDYDLATAGGWSVLAIGRHRGCRACRTCALADATVGHGRSRSLRAPDT